VAHVADGVVGERDPAAGRQKTGAEREQQDQHDPEPEVGDRHADQPDRERGPIRASPSAGPREETQRHPRQRGGRGGESRQLDSHREASPDHLADRLVLAEIEPEVSDERPAEPPEVLASDGLVQVEGLPEGGHRLRRRLVAEDDQRRVPGDQAHEDEDEQAHAHQEGRDEEEPPGDIGERRHGHAALRTATRLASAHPRPKAWPEARGQASQASSSLSSSDESGTTPWTFGFVQ